MKICTKCKINKELSEFNKSIRNKDGLGIWCRECNSLYKKEYSIRNKEILKEKSKQFRKDNKELIFKRKKKYREDNKELLKQKKKEYYEKNKHKLLPKFKEYRDSHHHQIKEYHKSYHKTDKGKIVFANLRSKRRFLKSSTCDGTLSKTIKMPLVSELQELLDSQENKCFYCENELADKHLDHVIPLSKGGTHSLNNVVWSCPTCNLAKGSKSIEEFRDYMPSL